MDELSMIQCAADTYQYISRIIENALKQTEQLLLKLKTRRDDTTITVKNKTVRLNEINAGKNKFSAAHMRGAPGYNAEGISDDLLPAVTSGYPRRASGASWHIMDLLRFPVDDEEPNLRHDDRIFTSLNHKSIMLMREYESIPKQQRLKSNDWYQKQSKTMDLHQQHAESDQRRAISHHQKSDQRHPGSDRQYQRLSELKDLPEQQAKHRKAFQQRPDFGEQFQQQPTFVSDIIHHQPDLRRQGQQLIGYGSWQQQQVKNVSTHRLTPDKGVCPEQVQKPYHRVYRMQKPKVNEYGRFSDKEEQNISTPTSHTNRLNIQDESKSVSKEDDSCAESTVEFLEEKESKKIQKPKPHRGRRKLDPELKPHREKPNERFSSFQIDKQTISSGSNDIHSARRSTSDTSVHCPKIKPKVKHKKKVKAVSTLERELAAEPSPPNEDEMSERSEEIRQTEKRKRGRKNKKLQSLEQHFATGPVPKQSRSSMVDPMGRRKIVMKGWKPHFKVKKIWLQDLSKE